MKVMDIMTKRPITVRKDDKLGKLVGILADNSITGCPVVDDKKNIIGVVGQTDILKFIDIYSKVNRGENFASFISKFVKTKEADFGKLKSASVSEFFRKGAITIDYDGDVYDAARVMNENSIDRLPVVKGKKLVGIITKSDIIRLLKKA